MRILPPDPTITALAEDHFDAVMMIFATPPPDDGKPHDLIKQFRQVTNGFDKAVIAAIEDPEN